MNFFKRNAGNQDTYVDNADTFGAQPEAPAKAQGGLEMTVMNPTEFSEVTAIAEEIRRGTTVVLNLDRASKELCRRLLDFLGGVVYTIDGGIKKVAATTYILTPHNVDVYDNARTGGEATVTREAIGGFQG